MSREDQKFSTDGRQRRAKPETAVTDQSPADPMLDSAATKYESISYLQVLERQLKVMDATAISLCMDNKLPIVVFNLRQPGNIRKVVLGEPIGTTVSI